MHLQNRSLFFGDNLEILKKYIPENSIDLIYLDPPFNSKKTYNILFKEGLRESESQLRAFEDTWHWTRESQSTFDELVTSTNEEIFNLMLALEKILGHNDVLAYLTMMAIRIIELKRILKPSGTIYLHCDPTASHYLKIVMDVIIGKKYFRNEIVWCYSGGGIPTKDFPRKHDVIFRYSKTDNYYYEPVYRPFTKGTLERGRTKVKGDKPLRKEGTPIPDWWFSNVECDKCGEKLDENIKRIASPTDPENLGYPTQKSEELLERIVKTSCPEGGWVLDPFCGCGTTVAVAERLNRNWVGIDISILAINLIKSRLEHQFPNLKDKINVDGIPITVGGAKVFWQNDPYQFEIWAVVLVGGRAKDNGVKGADKGIDGFMVIKDADDRGKPVYRKGIIQVKGGKVQRNHVATLKSDVDREKADFGIFITLVNPTRPMKEEAVVAGDFIINFNKSKYPKIQIITIDDLLKGKKLNLPLADIEAPLPRAIKSKIEAPRLFED